ncbi:MAG: hypothetical protein ACE5I3_09220 [Phycisphaerae bacterium]
MTSDVKKIEYGYDYLSRRVRKAVYAWDPNAADWSLTAKLDLRFMHHERNLLLELDGLDSLAKARKYVWGPDPGSGRTAPLSCGCVGSDELSGPILTAPPVRATRSSVIR